MVLISIALLLLFKPYRYHTSVYTAWNTLFAGAFLLLTMKCHFNSPILSWIGRYTFELYILQRIPMLCLSQLGLTNPYVFCMLSMVLLVLIAIVFHLLLQWIDHLLLQTISRKKVNV